MTITTLILIVVAAFLSGGLLTAALIFACLEGERDEREWVNCPGDYTEKK